MIPATPDRSRTLTGVALMLGAMAVLPFLDVVAKHLGQRGLPVMQAVWARMVFGALLTLPFVLRIGGARTLVPDRPLYHLLRAGFLIGATFSFFWSLKTLPIADALALFFVQPLIVTALSPLVLGEHVGPRRWAAVAVGFAGTLVIIRPGFQTFSPGMLLALMAGLSLALYMLMTRRISGRNHAMVTTFQTSLLGAAIATVAVWPVWQAPEPVEWALFLALGVIATGGHFLIVRAYDHCEASLLAPLAYTEMVMATVLGWWFFGDFPDRWTFVGVAILIASAIYISMREQKAGAGTPRDFEQP